MRKVLGMHLDEYVNRLDEIGGFGVGGVEPDLNLPSLVVAKTRDEERQMLLYASIHDHFGSRVASERDEFVPLKDFVGQPPVRVHNGWISGDGVTAAWIPGKGLGVLYRYKMDARRCLDSSRQALRLLYGIKAS